MVLVLFEIFVRYLGKCIGIWKIGENFGIEICIEECLVEKW